MHTISRPALMGIPTLPQSYVPRPRLDRRWEDWSERRLVLVMAGAGFGKTCFLSANAMRSNRPCLWLSLDDVDPDFPAFHLRLLALLRSAAGAPQDGSDPGNAPATPAVAAKAAAAYLGQIPGGAMLILDDAQHLSGSPETVELIESLVRHLQQGCTLLASAREPFGLKTARLRALGAMDDLTAEDLRMTEDEVADLLGRRYPGTAPDPGLARRIADETEGWAAGVEILLQLAGSSSTRAVEDALQALAQAGSSWFAYFAEEVLDQLDPHIRDFLLRSSVLPRLDPAACDAVLGIEGSRVILEDLWTRNLFTFPADERHESFRYHHLFREFLKERLARAETAAALGALHLRAARTLEAAGAWTEAALAYADAGRTNETLRMIERHGEAMLATGRYLVLRNAFETIPAARLRASAGAQAALGRLHEIQGRWDDAQAAYRRGLAVARGTSARSELLGLLAQIHMRRGEYGRCESLCREALRSCPRLDPARRGAIFSALGMAFAERGRVREAEGQWERALLDFRRARDRAGEGRVLFLLAANVHYARGDFERAKDAARQALVLFRESHDSRRICHVFGILGFVAIEAAEEREAREMTERALRMAESLGYRMIEGYCRHTLGRCALFVGDQRGAKRWFDTALRIGEELGEPSLRTLPLLGLAEVALAAGRADDAASLLREALRLARSRSDGFQEALALTLMGGLQEGPPRRRSWNLAERILREIGARFELHRLLLRRLASGEIARKRRSSVLRETIEGTARDAHRFLFVAREPAIAAPVLAEALAEGIEPDFAAGILVDLGERSVPPVARLLEASNEMVQARGIEILARIGGETARRALSRARDRSGRVGRAAGEAAAELEQAPGSPLAIRALGTFLVRIDDREIPLPAWRSERALRLFFFLLLQRFRWTPRDTILEALWPETDPEKAEISLRQSVLLLRKMLEPAGQGGLRLSPYVRFRNDAYILDPGRGYTYDVETFEKDLDEAARLANRREANKAEQRLRAALDQYGGDFLRECPYEDFLAGERERLRDRYLQAVHRLIDACTASRRWDESVVLAKQAIAADAYQEGFHEHLMRAQLELGNRYETLEAWHRYERMMRSELDLPPSPRMRALAERAGRI
jgi:ATP/maltotriose-dependent transcriptional regulator MalT/DNA-binding SARP family transcriptional activator